MLSMDVFDFKQHEEVISFQIVLDSKQSKECIGFIMMFFFSKLSNIEAISKVSWNNLLYWKYDTEGIL